MGVENYVATLKLTPVTDGMRCFAEWSAEFDCEEGRERETNRADRPGCVSNRIQCAENAVCALKSVNRGRHCVFARI